MREVVADAGRNPAQNTVTDAAKQRAPNVPPGWRQRTAPFAPWIIHLLWLAAPVATVAYLHSRSWGTFEPLPLMIAAIVGMAAWLQWSVAWALLARGSVVHRIVYFVAGAVGILVTADWIVEWRRTASEFPQGIGILAIGFAVPLSVVYWRGWRIERRSVDASHSPQPPAHRGQFSLGELMLFTAGLLIFLGLSNAQRTRHGQDDWGETVAAYLVVVCGTMFVVAGLATRRFVVAMTACLLTSLALVAAAIAWFYGAAIRDPSLWIVFGLVCSPALVGLLASIGLARWWGFRLRPSDSPPKGSG